MIERLRARLSAPSDAAGLAVFRALFGLLGVVSALRFLGYGWVEELFVAPRFHFHHWGLAWLEPLSPTGMRAVFVTIAITGACIALGLMYRVAIVAFLATFAYVGLLDVTSYLNHYYLVMLLALLASFMPLSRAWSLDALLWRRADPPVVPAWCYALLRAQVAIVYFCAGLAKVSEDWLLHAQPLNIWLSARTDTPIVGALFAEPWAPHAMAWAGCLFDLTIAAWLSLRPTRRVAFVAVLAFHALTKLLFPIGMFPFIMIVAATVFFEPEWPRAIFGAKPSPPRANAPGWHGVIAAPRLGHPESDEIVYVLEGEILVHAEGNPRKVGAGGVAINPRGVPHAFVVTSERARMLVIITPATQTEKFYRRASASGEAGPVDFGKIGEAARETGATVILGPPPFAPVTAG
jgi:hypothetical protein